MKRQTLICALTLLAASLTVASATPQDDIKAAAKKLGENYSWKSTTENANGRNFGGPTEGKMANGTTFISMTRRDNTVEAVLVGTNKGALKTDEGWRSLSEAAEDNGGGGFNWTAFTARMLQNQKAPADEAVELAGQAQDLKQDGDVISGALTEAGAKSLLSFRRGRGNGNGPDISNAKGSVKFWVKDGTLTKYESKVQGTVSFNGNDRDVDRTTTVEIKDVGTTKVEVPEGAKKKLP
jgi:hypothetical protein